jgi:DNA repair photolyase
VSISIAMLDRELARKLDPRAPTPQRRLALVTALAESGVPVGVNVAPVIPQLTDRDLEAILEAAAAAGARYAAWTMLRLPLEVAPLFRDWLAVHYPLRAAHVMSIVRRSAAARQRSPLPRAHGRSRRIRRLIRSASRSPASDSISTAIRSAARHDALPPPSAPGAAASSTSSADSPHFWSRTPHRRDWGMNDEKIQVRITSSGRRWMSSS